MKIKVEKLTENMWEWLKKEKAIKEARRTPQWTFWRKEYIIITREDVITLEKAEKFIDDKLHNYREKDSLRIGEIVDLEDVVAIIGYHFYHNIDEAYQEEEITIFTKEVEE